MPCNGRNRHGQPCAAPEHVLNADNLCPCHRPGGLERMRAVASKGGRSTKAKRDVNRAFSTHELPKLRSMGDAQRRLDLIQSATLQRRITHNESTAATKAVSEWVRAEQVKLTEELVSKLRVSLEEKKKEIETLRNQVARLTKPPLRSVG